MWGYHLKFGRVFIILGLSWTWYSHVVVFLVIAVVNKFCYLLMTNLANQGSPTWIWGEQLIVYVHKVRSVSSNFNFTAGVGPISSPIPPALEEELPNL